MRYPEMPMPTTESLRQTDLGTLAGKTEIWLEAQRPCLARASGHGDAGYRRAARSACAAITDPRR